MKRLIITLLLTVLIFCCQSHEVYAVTGCPIVPTPDPLITPVAIAGVNCGNPIDACNQHNKCCVNTIEQKINVFYTPFITKALDLLSLKNPLDFIKRWTTSSKTIQNNSFTQACVYGSPTTPGNVNDPSCICVEPTETPLKALEPMCKNLSTQEQQLCLDCLKGSGSSSTGVGVWTSIGCVKSDLGLFIRETIFSWAIGFAGGIALLCIIYSALMMQTSGGNAEKIKKSRELLTSCIMGLMLIIFSVLILRIIGVNIFRIPGFK